MIYIAAYERTVRTPVGVGNGRYVGGARMLVIRVYRYLTARSGFKSRLAAEASDPQVAARCCAHQYQLLHSCSKYALMVGKHAANAMIWQPVVEHLCERLAKLQDTTGGGIDTCSVTPIIA